MSDRVLSRLTRSAVPLMIAVASAFAVPRSARAARVHHTPGTAVSSSSGSAATASFVTTLRAINASRAARMIPTFSRQTKLACSACHNQFPQLTPFGRLFKLNGYTLSGLPTISAAKDTAGNESLKLEPIAPAAAMMVASVTNTAKTVPGTQNTTAAFPQEASLFLAGELSPKLGAFTQFTYSGADGSIGIDNIDFRYASHTTLAGRDLLYGVTLHNNPTVEDVWNTTPAWSFPFMGTEAAPAPAADVILDGGLSQQVLGLGVYSMFDNHLYTEVSTYRSAPQGVSQPLDSTAENTVKGLTPYWRVALQNHNENLYAMLGTFGLSANVYPSGVTGPTNRYTDVGVDAQVEKKVGDGTLIGRAAFIHESQTLDAFVASGEAAQGQQDLSVTRVSVSYIPSYVYGFSAAYFNTSGTADTLLFAPGPISGSRVGSPNSSGILGEFSFNPWQNTRLGIQYQMFTKFNGQSKAYDVPGGRAAADNNTLYLYTWLAF